MIEKILLFMEEAGKIALAKQRSIDQAKSFLKDSTDSSIVTEVDQEISGRFAAFVKKEFSDLNSMIVDEETVAHHTDIIKRMAETEYQFIIDPIDGTLPYSLKMPLFGISVGVLRHGKPYMGVVYMPATREIVYFDGKKAYWIQDAFTTRETRTELVENDKKEPYMLQLTWHVRPNVHFNHREHMPMNIFSAVAAFLYMATHRMKAAYVKLSLWDMAGVWPILRHLGFECMNYDTGKVLDEFKSETFTAGLKMRNVHIFCKPKDFNKYKGIVDVV